MASMTSFGQRNKYQIPEYDFVVFCEVGEDFFSFDRNRKLETYTVLELDKDLKHSIEMTRYSGNFPGMQAIFYNKGIKTYQKDIGGLMYQDTYKEILRRTVVVNTDTFSNLEAYKTARKAVLAKGNTYILEGEFSCNFYFYVVISDKGDKDNKFFSKLSDMEKHFYKGEFVDYFFDSFEDFDYVANSSETLYKLKIYYSDFPDRMEWGKVFTRKDCKNVFGSEWLFRSKWLLRNDEYKLIWYEYEK